MSEPQIENMEKLAAMLPSEENVAGLKLKPFSAASLILLQLSKNPLVSGAPFPEEEQFFYVASFLFILTEDNKKVAKLVRDPEAFRAAVLEFASGFSLKVLAGSIPQVQEIIQKATAGLDFQVDETSADPNKEGQRGPQVTS